MSPNGPNVPTALTRLSVAPPIELPLSVAAVINPPVWSIAPAEASVTVWPAAVMSPPRVRPPAVVVNVSGPVELTTPAVCSA